MDLNETLQASLADIEHGLPLEEVLKGLPVESQELVPLICLAAATRSVSHPVMRPEIAHAQQSRVAHAARAARGDSPRPALWGWLAKPRNALALGGGLAFVLVVIAAAVGINMLLNGDGMGKVARLADVSGLVEAAPSAESEDWHFVSADEPLQEGQRIRTYADSTVTLAYYEGSRTLVGPNSDLVVQALSGSGNALQVLLAQSSGLTSNAVVPLRGNGSYFHIDTPAGLVSVQGTSFNVDVIPGGEVLFEVVYGKVQVKNDVSEVILLSGQATTALPGADIADPGYQFNLTGKVESIQKSVQGELWKVSGVEFSVTSSTEVLGSYPVGNWVRVKGRILETGEWVANRIEPAQNEKLKATFTGVIESIPGTPGVWKIGGHEVMVTKETEVDAEVKVTSPVEVSFVVQPDGSWLAKEIELLDEEKPEPTATPTPSETPTDTPTPTFTPTPAGTLTPTPTPTATFTPSPTFTGTPATATPTPTMTVTSTVMPKNENSRCDNRTNMQPEGLRLAARYHVTYEEIMAWFCKGFGFGEIDLAYGLSQASNIPVAEIFSMRTNGMGWGNIKKAINAQTTSGTDNKNKGKPPKSK